MIKIFRTIVQFYAVQLPKVLVWIALIILAKKTFDEFFYNGNFSTLLPFYFSAIGVSVALASVTFTYSNVKTQTTSENTVLVSAGELFLYAALSLVNVLLITWFGFEANNYLEGYSWYNYTKFVIIFVFSGSLALIFFAANGLSKGLEILENHIWFKVRDEVK